MARRLGKRKRPEREKHMIHEQLKIEEGVFDSRTMMALWRMFNHNIISRLDFMIAGGKEANIYLADHGTAVPDDVVVLKIFRLETSSFDKRIDYMLGDPRFEKIKMNIRDIVNTWCKKEYGNLKLADYAGIHAPKPYYFKDNILAMEFIGKDGVASPQLKNVKLEDPRKTFNTIISDMRKLYAAELVHADISEYNILMKDDIPYIIDFGQAVVTKHPRAEQFLERDVSIICRYFERAYGLRNDEEKILQRIRSVQE